MKYLLVVLSLLPLLAAAQVPTPPENLVQYAHPLVGTAKMGHTYPGATVPFGVGAALARYRHHQLRAKRQVQPRSVLVLRWLPATKTQLLWVFRTRISAARATPTWAIFW